jgi:hypothetical protein
MKIRKSMNIYYILAIVCTVGAMYCGYIATQQDGQETEKNLKTTIDNQSFEIKTLNKKIIELSESIIKQTHQITGEGSFPIANLTGGQDNGNQTQITIGVAGEFAIPNLTAKFVVIPDYSTVNGLDLKIRGIHSETLVLGTLRKSEMKSYLVETKTNETAVIIYFNSDNHSWTESIRIRKDGGRKSIRYIQDQEGKYLFKTVDDNFPMNKNGDIVLWKNNSINIKELK